MRMHRVGSITAGIALVGFGILFIIHMFMPALSYDFIYSLWPVILIGLGIEMLIANAFCSKFIYDKGAVFIMIIMTIFSMTMAYGEFILNYYN